jgi:glucuronosyltransferase
MFSKIFVGILVLFSVVGISLASRILVLHPSPSISHLFVARPLINELARRGHQVTMFSQFPQKNSVKNLRDIKVEVNESLGDLMKFFVDNSGIGLTLIIQAPKLLTLCAKGGEAILEHPEFKRLVKEEKFDLVIVGMFTTPFMFGAAGYFNAPQIGIWSGITFFPISMIVGNPNEASAIPHLQTTFQGQMTFLQRTTNFLFYCVDVLLFAAFNYYQNVVYKRNFPSENFMSYDEAKSNVSLILVNNHFSQDHVRPYVPGFLGVGGLQIKTTHSPLPDVSLLGLFCQFRGNFR